MSRINQILDEYIASGNNEFDVLAKIARVSGEYEGSKP